MKKEATELPVLPQVWECSTLLPGECILISKGDLADILSSSSVNELKSKVENLVKSKKIVYLKNLESPRR